MADYQIDSPVDLGLRSSVFRNTELSMSQSWTIDLGAYKFNRVVLLTRNLTAGTEVYAVPSNGLNTIGSNFSLLVLNGGIATTPNDIPITSDFGSSVDSNGIYEILGPTRFIEITNAGGSATIPANAISIIVT